ncbi:MAG: GIY-YIG nuclease family protein [Woeseiaceae bacterium]
MTGVTFSLYIVRCSDDTLYTGIACDVARRIAEHETGLRGAKYLRGKGPLKLEFSRVIGDRATASAVEYRVKRLSRAQKEAIIDGRLSLDDLPDASKTDQVSGAG